MQWWSLDFKNSLFKTVLDERSRLLPLLFSPALALNDYSVEGVEVTVIWVERGLKMTATSACPLSPLVLHTVMAGEEAVQQWHLYLIHCDKLSWPFTPSCWPLLLKLQCEDFHIQACMSTLLLLLCLFLLSSFPTIVCFFFLFLNRHSYILASL